MILNTEKICAIGQKSRCESKGCEWKNVFNQYCWLRPPELKCELKEKTKPQIKFKEVKIENKFKKIKPENKFKISSQDDWLKKIKIG